MELEGTVYVDAPTNAVRPHVDAWRSKHTSYVFRTVVEPADEYDGYVTAVDLWYDPEEVNWSIPQALADSLPWKATPNFVLEGVPELEA